MSEKLVINSSMNDTTKNWAIFLAAGVCVAAGVYGFYRFAESALALRMLMVIAGLAAGAGVAYASVPGKEFVQFARRGGGNRTPIDGFGNRSFTTKLRP